MNIETSSLHSLLSPAMSVSILCNIYYTIKISIHLFVHVCMTLIWHHGSQELEAVFGGKAAVMLRKLIRCIDLT